MKLCFETTPKFPRHVYWLSNDKRTCYGYFKAGTTELMQFSKPMPFDPRGRDLMELKK